MRKQLLALGLAGLLLVILSLGTKGCGLKDPTTTQEQTQQTRQTEKPEQAENPAEDPEPEPDDDLDQPNPGYNTAETRGSCRGRLDKQARKTAQRFVGLYTNWNYQTIVSGLKQLDKLTGGDLKANLRVRKQVVAEDQTIRRDRQAHQGTVLAIDLSPTTHEKEQWVGYVLLRETETANGTPVNAEELTAYAVTLTQQTNHWKVTKWEPVK